MTYQNALRYLDSFYDYEKKPSRKIKFVNLNRIKKLARLFGDPQNTYKTIHITGTKGKGSTSSLLSNILLQAGFKVGLYTSPHISDLRERIKINNIEIEKKELVRLVQEVKEKLKSLSRPIRVSFFEIFTLIAFNYFKLKNVDFVIFEVGMGGRFDATNVINPLACAVTSVSYDHTRELGNRLVDIASEKVEIIKKGTFCISAPQNQEVMRIIKSKCLKEKVPFFSVGKDIKYKSRIFSSKEEVFDLKGMLTRYDKLRLRLLGEHQLVNSSVAVGLAEILISRGYGISKSSIYKGIKNTILLARCEVLRGKPTVIIDAAHNRASIRALKETVIRNFKFKKLILVLSLSKDKNIEGICRELSSLADKIVITKANTPRAAEPAYIKGFFKNKDVVIARDMPTAYNISKASADINDIILVTGSFYMVGEARKLFEMIKHAR